MAEIKRRFEDGEIIFREGDTSLAAYVVLSGVVELYKAGTKEPILLATLKKGEMFGEMGIFDGSPRSATAIAHGPVALDVIPKSEFLRQLEEDFDLAKRVMGKLVHRLRNADDMLAEQRPPQPLPSRANLAAIKSPPPAGAKCTPATPAPPTPGLLGRLFSQVFRSVGQTVPGEQGRPFVVLYPPIPQEGENKAKLEARPDEGRKKVIAALDGSPWLRLPPAQPVPLIDAAVPVRSPVFMARARILLADEGADLLIWGGSEAGGEILELTLVAANPQDRPGVTVSEIPLILPGALEGEWVDLLRGQVIASLDPRTENEMQAVKAALVATREAVAKLAAGNFGTLSTREQAGILAALAQIEAASGYFEPACDGLAKAEKLYQKALKCLPRDARREAALLVRAEGVAAQTQGERSDDIKALKRAMECYQEAMLTLSRDSFPRDWAILQGRLGSIFHRMERRTGDIDYLKRAIGAFQGALAIISKVDDPVRWADVTNNFCQALQVYGDLMKNHELLGRAIDLAKALVESRSKESTPLLWAAAQNNLGSAHFLSAKHSADTVSLIASADAFRAALEIYEAYGVAKMAQVAQANLDRADKEFKRRTGRRVADPDWGTE